MLLEIVNRLKTPTQTNNFLFKVYNRITRKRFKISSKLRIKKLEWRNSSNRQKSRGFLTFLEHIEMDDIVLLS